MPLMAMRRDEDFQISWCTVITMAVASWDLEASMGILCPGIGSEPRTEMRDTGALRSKRRVEQMARGSGSLRREWVGKV